MTSKVINTPYFSDGININYKSGEICMFFKDFYYIFNEYDKLPAEFESNVLAVKFHSNILLLLRAKYKLLFRMLADVNVNAYVEFYTLANLYTYFRK